jgi:hypothetical protein
VVRAYGEETEELAIAKVLARGVEEGQLWPRGALMRREELARVSIRELARTRLVGYASVCALESSARKRDSVGRWPHCRS